MVKLNSLCKNYTDGSKKSHIGVGCSVWMPSRNKCCKYFCITSSECLVINKAIDFITNQKSDSHYAVLTDSLACIQALSSSRNKFMKKPHNLRNYIKSMAITTRNHQYHLCLYNMRCRNSRRWNRWRTSEKSNNLWWIFFKRINTCFTRQWTEELEQAVHKQHGHQKISL